MATTLHDSTVVVAVVRTHPRAIPLAMISMRKSTHGLPFLSYTSMGLRLAALWFTRLDNLPTAVWERSPRSSPELMAGIVDFALLILTNKISACLIQAGCINYLSCSSKEVVEYEERSC